MKRPRAWAPDRAAPPLGSVPALGIAAERPWPATRGEPALLPPGAASALLHAAVLALILSLANAMRPPPPPEAAAGFDVVFGDAPAEVAAPTPPDTETPPPQVNLFGDDGIPVPQTVPHPPPPVPRPPLRPRPRRLASSNPFAGLPIYGFRGGRTPQSVRAAGLSLDATSPRGAVSGSENPNIQAPGADGSFLEALSEYVESHKYYPDLAVRNGEQGTSVIKAIFNRDGTVKSVQLLGSAGSRTLDVAWMNLFRGKKIAPFPPNMSQATQVVTLSMSYELVPE